MCDSCTITQDPEFEIVTIGHIQNPTLPAFRRKAGEVELQLPHPTFTTDPDDILQFEHVQGTMYQVTVNPDAKRSAQFLIDKNEFKIKPAPP